MFGLICGKGKVLADRKITELANITGADLADGDEFVVVDASADETKAITFGELKSGLDTATGFVRITGDTMTGALDVQSTITADGLTVDGDILVSDGTPSITLSDADGTNQTFTLTHNSATSTFDVRNNTSHGNMLFRSYDGTSYQNKMRLDSSGDISFYEDTGTTAKFFWDASAESLGIGTSSPLQDLHISSTSGTKAIFERTGSTGAYIGLKDSSGSLVYLGDNNGTFEVQTAGSSYSTKLAVTSAGNVGIGISNPFYNLVVSSGGASGIEFAPAYSGTANLVQHYSRSGAVYVDAVNVAAQHRFNIGGSEKMRIDSSGNVGIGTSSPSYPLTITSASNAAALAINGRSSDNLGVAYWFANDGTTAHGDIRASASEFRISSTPASAVQTFYTNGSERMRITSAGDVSISGDLTGLRYFDVYNTASTSTDGSIIRLITEQVGSTTTTSADILKRKNGELRIANNDTDAAAYIAFNVGSSERMRLDSSGNLLVGKTVNNTFNEGFVAKAAGGANVTSDGGTTLELNRRTSDGDIAVFRKDNTTVGSIGVAAGDDFYIGASTANHAGINFGTDIVYPMRANSLSDGVTSLGHSSNRFNNLYLSGKTYLNTSSGAQLVLQTDASRGFVGTSTSHPLVFETGATERMRIDSAGNTMFRTTNTNPSTNNVEGHAIGATAEFSRSGSNPVDINRVVDGSLIIFRGQGTSEGNVSVSGTTVSYNGGHLSRWSQSTNGARIDGLVKGTVMTNLDQMAVWGDEENEQLNCMAVSSVEGDPNVAGVFVNWDDDDETYTADMNIAMTGDMIIRIAQGTTVERGDLLMSAGDGTAKPQGDDIIRSKTIAKVTSTHVSCTYDDGSYCVPCVLMAC